MDTNIYFIRTRDSTNLIKIGVAKDVNARLGMLQTANHCTLEVLGSIPIASRAQAFDLERQIHSLFKYYRVRGEWFRSSSPVRNFILSVTNGMPLKEASQIAWTESKKHKNDYYNRVRRAGKGC